jgi:FAD/FMN-containing dehydrogenase
MFGDEAYRRLREIKAKFDPDNVIQANHEISRAGVS